MQQPQFYRSTVCIGSATGQARGRPETLLGTHWLTLASESYGE
jgi:hypothetical protein